MEETPAVKSATQTEPAGPNIVIKRHPIGLVLIYIESILAVAAIISLGVFAAPDYFQNLSSGTQSLIATGVSLLLVIVGIILVVATIVYRRNCLIVTDHDLEQINQRSLLVCKVTRLEMNDVEDVGAEQHGLLQTVFGYGKLTIETAGAIDNFVFIYCPRPRQYAKQILETRARYVAKTS